MDEAYFAADKRNIPAALAAAYCLEGADPHEFLCADRRCRAPVLAASFQPKNKREPYFASCRKIECHESHCACRGKSAESPADCHRVDCEYLERTEQRGTRRGRTVKAAELTLVAPTEFAIRRPEEVGGRARGPAQTHRIRIDAGNLSLYNLVYWLAVLPPETAVRIDLRFENRTLPIARWFRRPRDFVARDLSARHDAVESRRVYFGFAKIKPINSQRGVVRVQFEGHVAWDSDQRPLSLFTNERQYEATRKKQRFENMLSEIAQSSTPDRCFAFVLGSLNADKHQTFLNLDLGRGLEEVLLFPVSQAGKWFGFEHAWERFRGMVR